MLFTIGPVQMYERTLKKRSEPVPYFRNDEFSQVMLDSDRMLKTLMETADDSECFFLTASGTAAMEAAVMNVFTQSDKLLVIVGGTFGKRFSQICNMHGISHTDILLSDGEVLTADRLSEYQGKGYTGLLVNLHETSTGQLYDIGLISEFCRKNNMLLMVDAISTFLCDRYSMDRWGIDVTIVSSQKSFCSSPGISVVMLNSRTFNERVLRNPTQTIYFDFKDYSNNMKRGQTPFTPAVGTLYEMNDFMKFIFEKGLVDYLGEIAKKAEYFRSLIVSCDGIRIPDYPLSNAITPVLFEAPVAKGVYDYLRHELGMVVNPSGGNLAEHQIRVAHIGDISISDHKRLADGIIGYLRH